MISVMEKKQNEKNLLKYLSFKFLYKFDMIYFIWVTTHS